MSRFNFVLIATVFACLFLAACEKEEFTPNIATSTATLSEAETAHRLPTIMTRPVEAHVRDVRDELQAAPELTEPGTQFTVTSQLPTEKNLRYLEMLPEAKPQHQAAAALNIDCPYGDCATTIPAMVAQYQEIATAQCNDQFLSIACCDQGETTYVVVYIKADCLPARSR